jgi:hypothetical protein
VAVAFAGSDATSGIDSCDAPKTYGGPDSGAASVAGNCRDEAGNVGARSFGLKYDETPPPAPSGKAERAPDANGWYNHPVDVTFSTTDAVSGIAGCSSDTYGGPDAASASVSGTCTDKAGNTSAAGSFGLKYDSTDPTVTTAAAERPPDSNGWYNHDVGFAFAAGDSMSGPDGCTAPVYSGPDIPNASVTGTCRDRAGNQAERTVGFKYDETAPTASAKAGRPPDASSWYNHAVTISFTGSDATSGVDSCTSPTSYGGPDDANATVSGTCRDVAGNPSGPAALALSYDATAPTVGAGEAARPPDSNGWYNHPLTVSFPERSDGLSGIDSCTTPTYGGPGSLKAVVVGHCRDLAGNVGESPGFTFAYDSTAPGVRFVPGRRPDRYGWYSHDVRIDIRARDGLSGPGPCSPSSVVYARPNSGHASVKGSCTDVAGNTSSRLSTFQYAEPLLTPRAGVRFSNPPLLDWIRVERARFYNVQLWRGGEKILSRWPQASRFQLKRVWGFDGRRYRFQPVRYTWYVWPRLPGGYGKLIGKSYFLTR